MSSTLTFVSFLNFETSSQSSCLVNAVTPQEQHTSCYNFTWILSAPKSWTSLMLTYVWTLDLFNKVMVKWQWVVTLCEHDNCSDFPACCSFIRSNALHIKISAKFQELCAPSWKFTGIFDAILDFPFLDDNSFINYLSQGLDIGHGSKAYWGLDWD